MSSNRNLEHHTFKKSKSLQKVVPKKTEVNTSIEHFYRATPSVLLPTASAYTIFTYRARIQIVLWSISSNKNCYPFQGLHFKLKIVRNQYSRSHNHTEVTQVTSPCIK